MTVVWLDGIEVVVVEEGEVRVGVAIGTGMTVISLRSILVVRIVFSSVGESGPTVVKASEPFERGTVVEDAESTRMTSPILAQNPSRVEAVAKIPGAAVLATLLQESTALSKAVGAQEFTVG